MSYLTRRTAAARARRGAAFLDEKLGRGWRHKIKKRRLDMSRGGFQVESGGCGCVLAQLDAAGALAKYEDEEARQAREASLRGSYNRAREVLAISENDDEDVKLGFVAGDADESYEVLTEAWLEELRRPASA